MFTLQSYTQMTLSQVLQSPLPSSKTSYQSIISNAIGEMGRVQIFLIFAHCTPKIIMAWSMITVSFGAANTDWWKVSKVYDPIGEIYALLKVN